MKRVMVLLASVMMITATAPVFAADHSGMKMDTKDGVRECAMQAESIQEKIKRLEGEVASGNKKYSAKDLDKIKRKLKEANTLLENLNKP